MRSDHAIPPSLCEILLWDRKYVVHCNAKETEMASFRYDEREEEARGKIKGKRLVHWELWGHRKSVRFAWQ